MATSSSSSSLSYSAVWSGTERARERVSSAPADSSVATGSVMKLYEVCSGCAGGGGVLRVYVVWRERSLLSEGVELSTTTG